MDGERGRAGEERVMEFIAARTGARLYLLYHCAGQGMGVERAGARARRTLFCGKLKSPPSLFSFASRAFSLRFFSEDGAKPRVSRYRITVTKYRAVMLEMNDDDFSVFLR